MKKILTLLLGENQDIMTIILMLTPPSFFVLYILSSFPIGLKTVLTSVLAFDIFAGLLSNLQEKTHHAWKRQPRAFSVAFVVFHLTLYPLAVVLLQVSIPLMILMLAMLVTKTLAFAFGTKFWEKHDDGKHHSI